MEDVKKTQFSKKRMTYEASHLYVYILLYQFTLTAQDHFGEKEKISINVSPYKEDLLDHRCSKLSLVLAAVQKAIKQSTFLRGGGLPLWLGVFGEDRCVHICAGDQSLLFRAGFGVRVGQARGLLPGRGLQE